MGVSTHFPVHLTLIQKSIESKWQLKNKKERERESGRRKDSLLQIQEAAQSHTAEP